MRVLLLHLLHACILQLPWRMVEQSQTLTWVLTLPDTACDRLSCQPRYIFNRKNCVFCFVHSCNMLFGRKLLTGHQLVCEQQKASSVLPHHAPLWGNVLYPVYQP